MPDDGYNSENYKKQGSDHWIIGENGTLENKGIQKNKTIQFDDDYTEELTEVGQVKFNSDDKTLDVKLSSAVTANMPSEVLMPRCVNKTGSDIDDGTPVFVSGAQGNRPTIVPADATNYATASKTIGVTTQEIKKNAEGFVCQIGYVRNLDTSAWVNGTYLYLSTTVGEFTTTPPNPADGNIKIICAMVILQHETDGILSVKIMELKDWFGDIDNTNYAYFDANGIKVAKGSARVWEDIQFSVSNGRVPAANAPTFETFTTNTKEYSFDIDDFLYLQANEPPHGIDYTATNASWHVHVTNKTANNSGDSQFAKLQVIVGYASVGGIWTEETFTGECEIENGTAALTKKICSLNSATFDMSNVGIGGQIKPTIKRIAATGGTEYADNAFFTQVGLHALKDQEGSRTVSSK